MSLEAFHLRIHVGPRGKHGTISVLVFKAHEATRWFDELFPLIPEGQRPGTSVTVSHRSKEGTWVVVRSIEWSELRGEKFPE